MEHIRIYRRWVLLENAKDAVLIDPVRQEARECCVEVSNREDDTEEHGTHETLTNVSVTFRQQPRGPLGEHL